jgi:hypothetical protein
VVEHQAADEAVEQALAHEPDELELPGESSAAAGEGPAAPDSSYDSSDEGDEPGA